MLRGLLERHDDDQLVFITHALVRNTFILSGETCHYPRTWVYLAAYTHTYVRRQKCRPRPLPGRPGGDKGEYLKAYRTESRARHTSSRSITRLIITFGGNIIYGTGRPGDGCGGKHLNIVFVRRKTRTDGGEALNAYPVAQFRNTGESYRVGDNEPNVIISCHHNDEPNKRAYLV